LKLPNADRVRIDDRKVRGYLLSKAHPVGRFKARVFSAVGFDEGTLEAFVAELRRIASSGEVSEVEDFAFGKKYTVPGELKGPSGSVAVLTVWVVESAQVDPRLITVRPR
jgi:hypothetical protein